MKLINRDPLFRWIKFNAVGIMGGAVHFGMLFVFVRFLTMHYLWATALSVEMAIIHNFLWHWNWTWADRRSNARGPAAQPRMLAALGRFNLANGLISLSGNLLSAGILTGLAHLDPILANVLAQIPCCLANFLISDRFVFVDAI